MTYKNDIIKKASYFAIPVIGVLFILLYIKTAGADVVYSDYIRIIAEYLPDVGDIKRLLVPDILTRIPATFLARFINVVNFRYSVTFDRVLGVTGIGIMSVVLALYFKKYNISFRWQAAIYIILFSLNKWEILLNGTAWAHVVAFGFFFISYYMADMVWRGETSAKEELFLCLMPLLLLLIAGEYIASYCVTMILISILGILVGGAGENRMAGMTAAFRSMIGYVPDAFGIYNNLKVSEYMEFFAACVGIDGMEARKKSEQLLSYVELSDKADFYVEALSRGMKQKLALARALINDPPILIMDEPTSGLDPRTRYEFKQIVGELSDSGKTIIISSHILSDISELCTDIGIIDQGSIVMSGRLMDVMRIVAAENPIIISMSKKTTQAIKFLREDNSVKSLAIKGNDLMINIRGGAKEEAELLRRMIEAGLPVRSFSREKGSLESIFMQLTGHGEEHTISGYDAF